MSGPEQVLLFQVGARLFAARAAGIERVGPPAGAGLVLDSPLGRSLAPSRSLVCAGGGAALGVDRVLGVRRVDPADLRPLPAPADGCLATGAVAGLLLLDGALTPLVDLPTLIRGRPDPAAPDRR